MNFRIEQQAFSGPLGLLLELLERRELEIRDVHLAKIADDFLVRMELQEVPTEELADFLVVASRLIYLKSRELMPFLRVEEEDDGVESLEDQLRLYQEFSEAAGLLEGLFTSGRRSFERPYRPQKKVEEVAFRPSKNVGSEGLRDSFLTLLKKLEPFFALQETSIERIQSVEERLIDMKNVLESRSVIKFKEVIQGSKSKAEVVVSFLALLELVRRRIIKVSQVSKDIQIEKV